MQVHIMHLVVIQLLTTKTSLDAIASVKM